MIQGGSKVPMYLQVHKFLMVNFVTVRSYRVTVKVVQSPDTYTHTRAPSREWVCTRTFEALPTSETCHYRRTGLLNQSVECVNIVMETDTLIFLQTFSNKVFLSVEGKGTHPVARFHAGMRYSYVTDHLFHFGDTLLNSFVYDLTMSSGGTVRHCVPQSKAHSILASRAFTKLSSVIIVSGTNRTSYSERSLEI